MLAALLAMGLLLPTLQAAESSADDAGPAVVETTTEHLSEPTVQTESPRFSWKLDSDRRDQRQQAYELEVSQDGSAAIWSSGRVESDQQTLVEYGGDALTSNTAYQWRVRVWDAEGRGSAWSDPARFATGLLSDDDWTAQWISPAGAPEGGSYLRQQIALDAAPVRATLFVSGRGNYERGPDGHGICCEQDFGLARGIYEPYVNGDRIGDAELESQLVDSRVRSYYRAWDVTAQVNAGANVWGVTIGEDSDIIAQLEVEYAGGGSETFATGAEWQSHAGPTTRAERYNGESYDVRREVDDWMAPDAAREGWQPVRVVDAPRGALDAAPNEPMRVVAEHQAVAITEPAPGVFVLDFGQNRSGRTRITTTIADGATVTLKHGERLTNGRVDNALITAAQTSRITGDGGEVTFSPSYTYAGFRWVEVTGLTSAPSPTTVVAEEIHNDVTGVGSFGADDELLRRLHAANVQTQVNGLHGIPEDTPTREKRGWMADAHIAAEATMNNRNMAAFYSKWITDIRDASAADGRVPDIVPKEVRASWDNGSDPAWAAATALVPYYAWQYYGDRRIVDEHYESVVAWVDYVGTTTTDHLVTRPASQWGNDWLSIQPTEGRLFRTGFYYWGAKVAEEFARELGKDAEAERHSALAADIAKAINDAYFDGRSSYGPSQFSNAFPLFLGIVPEDHADAVVATLVKDVMETRKGHFTGGLPGIKYIPEALQKYGRSDVVLDVVRNTEYPGWGYMLDNGPGTIWEDWHAGASSLNHPMFTSIDHWLYTAVAGISQAPGSVGFKELVFDPEVTADLASANARRETPYGEASVSWKTEGDTVRIAVSVPFGTTAQVHVPGAQVNSLAESGKPARDADGVHEVTQADDSVVVTVGSGDYEFATDAKLGRLVTAAESLTEARVELDASPDTQLIARADAAVAAVNKALAAYLSGSPAQDEALAALASAYDLQSALDEDDTAALAATVIAVDALSAFLGASLGVEVSAVADEGRIAPGGAVTVTATVVNSGTLLVSQVTSQLEVPTGWDAAVVADWSADAVGTGESVEARFRVTAAGDESAEAATIRVLIALAVEGTTLNRVIPIQLSVGSAAEVGGFAVDPGIAEAGGYTYVRAEVANHLGSTATGVSLQVSGLPRGWSIDGESSAEVPPSGTHVLSLRLKASSEADSGQARARIVDAAGRVVAEQPVLLLVRGSANCGMDPSGSACVGADKRVLANFENTVDGWVAGANTSAVHPVMEFANGPRKPTLGAWALEATPSGEALGRDWRTVSASFDNPVAIGSAHHLTLDANMYGGGGGGHRIRVLLTGAEGAKVEHEVTLAPDSWNDIAVPLAGLEGQAIAVIEVSLRTEGGWAWPGRFQLDSVLLDGSVDVGENLARGRSAAVSSPLSCCGWQPDRLTDGVQTSTADRPGISTDPARAQPDHVEWVSVDLGETRPLGRVVLYPRTQRAGETAEITGRNFPVDFVIQVSDDAQTWVDVGAFTGQGAGNGLPRSYRLSEGAEGRYLRVYVTKLGPGAPDEQGPATGGHRLQLAELEAFGPSASELTFGQQPQPVSIVAGEDARFGALASGDPQPTVVWEVSRGGSEFEPIASALGNELLLPTVRSGADGLRYRAVVSNGGEPLAAEPALLTVSYVAPAVATQPRDTWVDEGQTRVEVSADVDGTGLRYQWQRSGDGAAWYAIPGQTAADAVLTLGEDVADGDRVRLVAWNGLAEYVITEPAGVGFARAPVISGLPERVSARDGEQVRLVAEVSGVPTPGLQWFTRPRPGADWTAIQGETAASLAFASKLEQDGAQFMLRATNSAGEVDSAMVSLSVRGGGPEPTPEPTQPHPPDSTPTLPTVRPSAPSGGRPRPGLPSTGLDGPVD